MACGHCSFHAEKKRKVLGESTQVGNKTIRREMIAIFTKPAIFKYMLSDQVCQQALHNNNMSHTSYPLQHGQREWKSSG